MVMLMMIMLMMIMVMVVMVMVVMVMMVMVMVRVAPSAVLGALPPSASSSIWFELDSLTYTGAIWSCFSL